MGKLNRIEVLLVEDNPGDAVLIREYLNEDKQEDHGIHTVQTMAAALDYLRTGTVDVILLDLNLPDSAGMDTINSIMSATKGLPVIVLTGLDDGQAGLDAIRLGVQDYLVKGLCDTETVRRTINYAIDRQSTLNLLLHHLDFHQEIVNAFPSPAFYVDVDLAIVGWNTASENLLGLSRMDVLGSSATEALPECLAALFDDKSFTDMDERVTTLPPIEVLDAQGATRPMTAVKTVYKGSDGKPGGFIVVLSDA